MSFFFAQERLNFSYILDRSYIFYYTMYPKSSSFSISLKENRLKKFLHVGYAFIFLLFFFSLQTPKPLVVVKGKRRRKSKNFFGFFVKVSSSSHYLWNLFMPFIYFFIKPSAVNENLFFKTRTTVIGNKNSSFSFPFLFDHGANERCFFLMFSYIPLFLKGKGQVSFTFQGNNLKLHSLVCRLHFFKIPFSFFRNAKKKKIKVGARTSNLKSGTFSIVNSLSIFPLLRQNIFSKRRKKWKRLNSN